jgi:hypothetical protein
VVADLNHHLRNALDIILASDYLRQTDRATAICESVERIDHALTNIIGARRHESQKHSGNTSLTGAIR